MALKAFYKTLLALRSRCRKEIDMSKSSNRTVCALATYVRKERQRMIQDQVTCLNILNSFELAWNASVCFRGQMRREQSMSAMEF